MTAPLEELLKMEPKEIQAAAIAQRTQIESRRRELVDRIHTAEGEPKERFRLTLRGLTRAPLQTTDAPGSSERGAPSHTEG